MTLHDFIAWIDDRGFDIAASLIDHGTVRIELTCGRADNAEGRLPLGRDADDEVGSWGAARALVDDFGGWARWFGSDVIVKTEDGPTIAFRTECDPLPIGSAPMRYPETRLLPWPPPDDDSPPDRFPASIRRRPDFMSLTEYHGDA